MARASNPNAPSLGCSFAVGFCGLLLVTGTLLSSVPSLAAPVRLELAAGTLGASPSADGATPLAGTAAPNSPSSDLSLPVSAPGSAPAYPNNPWAAAIPAAACIPTDLPQTGRVVEVIDGQTIRVLMDRDQRVYSVRFIGLDLPRSLSPALARQAALHNAALAFGQHATLVRDLTDQDAFGRLLRYVMVGSTFLNYDLIAGGYARAKPAPPDVACSAAFAAAEQQAELNSLGLWAPSISAP